MEKENTKFKEDNTISNIDYEKIYNIAQKITKSFRTNGVPIIFPQPNGKKVGIYKIKLFINPSTPNVVWRKIVTHKFGDEIFPCLTNYGLECEFCEAYKNRTSLITKNFLLLRKRYLIYGFLLETNVPNYNMYKNSIVILSYVEYLHNILMEKFSESLKITEDLLAKKGKPVIISNDPSIKSRYTLEILDEIVDISDKLNVNLPSLLDVIVSAEISDNIINTVKNKTQDFIKYTDILVKTKTSRVSSISIDKK